MAPREKKIRVLAVDDSALMRALLQEILPTPDIEVAATASNGEEALKKLETTHPDVVTLDVEMPKMDGLTCLKKIMATRPTPVVMVSSLTQEGAEITFSCLAAGAVDFFAKPSAGLAHGIREYKEALREKIRAAAAAKLCLPPIPHQRRQRPSSAPLSSKVRLVCIGASTGGTEALPFIISRLPQGFPPIAIVQHMPPKFTAVFANRMNQGSALTVLEAQGGERLLPGHAFLAPGGKHLRVAEKEGRLITLLGQDEPLHHHRPSVDVLFFSAASLGKDVVAVILTGMGKDGAEGLLEIRRRGSYTIAQDEATSVVWGMPREAAQRGGACEVLPLADIPERLLALAGSAQLKRKDF